MNNNKKALNKDIDIAIKVLLMLKHSDNIYGSTEGINYTEIRRTRIIVNDLLKRNENYRRNN